MRNRFTTAHEFWTAGALTATVCFLTPRPLRLMAPVMVGYLLYRIGPEGYPWSCAAQADQLESDSASCWQESEEYFPAGLGDPVDESGQESFPASDPPSFSPGTAAPAAHPSTTQDS